MKDQNKEIMSEGESGIASNQDQEPRSKWGWIFLFVIGFLIGVSVKAQAMKTVTMGFNDFKLKDLHSDFELTAKRDDAENAKAESQEGQEPVGEESQPQGENQSSNEGMESSNAQ